MFADIQNWFKPTVRRGHRTARLIKWTSRQFVFGWVSLLVGFSVLTVGAAVVLVFAIIHVAIPNTFNAEGQKMSSSDRSTIVSAIVWGCALGTCLLVPLLLDCYCIVQVYLLLQSFQIDHRPSEAWWIRLDKAIPGLLVAKKREWLKMLLLKCLILPVILYRFLFSSFVVAWEGSRED